VKSRNLPSGPSPLEEVPRLSIVSRARSAEGSKPFDAARSRKLARHGKTALPVLRNSAGGCMATGEPVTSLSFIGYAAATLTTLAFLPQVIRVWKTRSARDISLSAFSMLFVGAGLWLLHGIIIEDVPLIVGNSIGVLLIGGVLWSKIIHG
jgi:MtN3 and saliva related transmembrane protein